MVINNYIMSLVWILFQVIIGYNLVLPFILYLLNLFVKQKSNVTDNIDYDYAIIVTAYEQTHMLQTAVDSILNLNYKNYHVYIVADNCKIDNLNMSDSRVTLLRPEITLASNIKSHFYAIERFIRNHDILTIIDSDNLVDPEYINELNKFFDQGFLAVQGVREAKNLNTRIACLDAARDLYYNFYDSKILFTLGSSSTLAGSGMAFITELYKECLEHIEISGAGFDKVLQTQIVKNDLRIAYAAKAIVYDEKTTHSKQLINQRSRWINTWFKYFVNGFKLVLLSIQTKSINQFLFGIIILRPPLFIFILLSFSCFVVSVFFNPLHAVFWLFAFFIFILGFILALKKQNSSREVNKSLMSIPIFIFYQLISLYYSRIANKRSVATKHSRLGSIND